MLVGEAAGQVIGWVWGGATTPGQSSGVHLQLQVNISEPISIILVVPENNYFLAVPGT